MAEMTYAKEVKSYDDNPKNYVAQDELLVTITLAEYRELVEFKGKNEPEMRALQVEKWSIENELIAVKEKVAQLILKYESGDDCK